MEDKVYNSPVNIEETVEHFLNNIDSKYWGTEALKLSQQDAQAVLLAIFDRVTTKYSTYISKDVDLDGELYALRHGPQ